MKKESSHNKRGAQIQPIASSCGSYQQLAHGKRMVEGHLCILISTIFFGMNIPIIKVLIPEWMTAMDVTFFRLIIPAALFWIVSLFVRTAPIERADWWRVAVGGVFGLFSFLSLFNMALRYGNPIDISIIMTLPPVFVMLIGAIFQHRKVGLLEMVGVAVAFTGAVIVILLGGRRDDIGSNRLAGDLLAIASTVCYAFYLVILEGPTHKYSPASLLRWVFLLGAVPACALIPGVVHAPIWHSSGSGGWLLLAFVVTCPSFLAYFLMNPAIKLIGAEIVSVYQYFVPVVATIATVLMKLAHLHWTQAAAMVVIVGGMALITYGKRSRIKKMMGNDNKQ